MGKGKGKGKGQVLWSICTDIVIHGSRFTDSHRSNNLSL